jgi:hypothetical protein
MGHAEAQLVHDLRNVASVIRGAAQQLHEGHRTLPPAAVGTLSEMIARRSDMLLRLLEDLAVLQQVESGRLPVAVEEVDLAMVCRAALGALHTPDHVVLTLEVPPGTRVLGDPLRLTQVLDNLLTNAARYGGPHITLRADRRGDRVELSVTDDGPGVPEELRSRLFDTYVRGPDSERHGGSGLGLVIVRELSAAMGGSVAYRDEPTTFTVSLPAFGEAAEPGPDPLAAHSPHEVLFWQHPDELTDRVAPFLAAGLAAGEAVLVAATEEHHAQLRSRLEGDGLPVDELVAAGRYVVLDAETAHQRLEVDGAVDPARFDELVGDLVAGLSRRWPGVRAFGEIVDRFWRRGDAHLALELEACWDGLRRRTPFPLLCAYQIGPDSEQGAEDLPRERHSRRDDAVA